VVPSTRPRHGLGSDGSSGAYLGAAQEDEPFPPDILDPAGSAVTGERKRTTEVRCGGRGGGEGFGLRILP
jgi:hypothetical protein